MEDEAVLEDQKLLDSLTWNDGAMALTAVASLTGDSSDLECDEGDSSQVIVDILSQKADIIEDMMPVTYCIEAESECPVPYLVISDSTVEFKISCQMLDQWNTDAASAYEENSDTIS